MKRETYRAMLDKIRRTPVLYGYIIWSDRILTRISYIIYPLFLLYLVVNKKPELGKAILVSAVSFIVLHVFRYLYDAPRPYQVFGLFDQKRYQGKIFPQQTRVFRLRYCRNSILYLSSAGDLSGGLQPFACRIQSAGRRSFHQRRPGWCCIWDPVRNDHVYTVASAFSSAGSVLSETGFLLSFCGRNVMNSSTLTSIRIG